MDIKYGRKRSGIRRALNKKLEDWVSSIDNQDLQLLIKKNVIVTGGSIVSMAMGDQVNDFDLYFKTNDVAEAVAKYYVDQFNSTHEVKKETYVRDYTPEVERREVTNLHGIKEEVVSIWIQSAGVVAEEQKEYNYFENLSEDVTVNFVESLAEEVNKEKPKYRPVFMSQNAITLSDKIQLVLRFTGEAAEIHKNFDFTHTICYYDWKSENLVMPAEALECMLSRTLVYQGSLYPIASIFRTKKFLERGWRITAGQQLKILWQISELNLSNIEILREQLTGVDMAYMWQLINALKDIEPEKINATYIAAIIDKIFD